MEPSFHGSRQPLLLGRAHAHTGEAAVDCPHTAHPAGGATHTLRVVTVCLLCAALLAGVVFAAAYVLTLPRMPVSPSRRVLFLFRDAGETFALLPVLQQPQTWAARGVTASALVTGGGTCPFGNNSGQAPLPANVTTLVAMGIITSDQFLHDRNATLPAAALARLLARLGTPLPTVVVTGLVSAVQLQLTCALAMMGATIAGFDDSFGDWDGAGWPGQIVRSGCLSKLFVTAEEVARRAEAAAPAVHAEAVGSPALAQWQTAVSPPAKLAVMRATLFPRLPLARPLLTFYGGYGDGYLDSVRLLAACLQGQTVGSRQPVAAAFLRHPGPFDSHAETAIFEAAGVNVTIVNRTAISAADLAALSNVTMSQDSTVNVQSLYIGVPSM